MVEMMPNKFGRRSLQRRRIALVVFVHERITRIAQSYHVQFSDVRPTNFWQM